MSFKSAEGSKFIDVDTSFVNFPVAQGLVAFPAGLTTDTIDANIVGVNTSVVFPDSSVQTKAFFGGGTPIVFNQPVGPATASGSTANIFFNQTLVTGGVYACSVSVECLADVSGQSLDDYEVTLSYNNVNLSKTQIYGVGDADSIISIPMTGFFIAVNPSSTLIKCAVKCVTSGGGTWNFTADTILNLVRIA